MNIKMIIIAICLALMQPAEAGPFKKLSHFAKGCAKVTAYVVVAYATRPRPVYSDDSGVYNVWPGPNGNGVIQGNGHYANYSTYGNGAVQIQQFY